MTVSSWPEDAGVFYITRGRHPPPKSKNAARWRCGFPVSIIFARPRDQLVYRRLPSSAQIAVFVQHIYEIVRAWI